MEKTVSARKKSMERRQAIRNVFSAWLDQYLAVTGKTHIELAAELGLSSRTVHGWVTGQAIPRLHSLTRLADATGADLEWLCCTLGIPPHAEIRTRYASDPHGSLPALLDRWMRREGLTSREAAARAGMSSSWFSRLHAGSQMPSAAALMKLSRASAIPLEDLVKAARPTARTAGRLERSTRFGASTFAGQLNQRMADNGWTPQDLADAAGVSLDSLRTIRSGDTAELEDIARVAYAADMPASTVLRAAGVRTSGLSEMELRRYITAVSRTSRTRLSDLVRSGREGRTLRELASAADLVSPQTLCHIQAGRTGLSARRRVSLARHLGQDPVRWLVAA